VTLKNGTITVNYTEMSTEGMYGRIVGAGMASLIEKCTAQADIILPDNVANAGIVGGGLEMTSVVGCTATGTITAGEGARWIGGITGYAGGFEDESAGLPVTVFTGCTTENVTFDLPEDSEGVGEIVGSGFYSEEAAEAMGVPFDQPTVYEIVEEAA